MNHSKDETKYTMGRSREETDRLIRQSQLYENLTRRFFKEAGLVRGMRVLDIGSGAGDVALAAAEQVGPEGRVVGVDVDEKILETARERAAKAGWTHVEFLQGDARILELGSDFDALVGRYILMYMPDPSEALKQFIVHLRPGAIVAFQEIDFTFQRTINPLNTPLVNKLIDWVVEVFERSGAHVDMGLNLYRVFLEAGLPEPLLEGTLLGGVSEGWPGYRYIADSFQSVLPLMEEFGIATSEDVDVKTLPERLRKEVVATKSPILLPLNITAWTRLPMGNER